MSGHGKIIMSSHAKVQMGKRGYTKGDVVCCLFNGKVIERQLYNKIVVQGKDRSSNPMVVVIAEMGGRTFKIVTVMPPIDRHRFRECI